MAGTAIGEVNINLRMSLAQFSQDVKQGQAAASTATKQIASDTTANVGKAREALLLMSEDFGVTIPRGIRSMIAELPGVGSALNAAFSSVALIAVIDIISKVIDKFAEFQAHADAVTASWNEVGDVSRTALANLSQSFVQLEITLDKLNGDDLKALSDQLKYIDGQTLAEVISQFDALQKAADKAFTTMQQGAFQSILSGIASHGGTELKELIQPLLDLPQNLFGSSLTDKIKVLQDGFDDLTARVKRFQEAGDSASVYNEIVSAIAKLSSAQAIANKTGADPAYKDALQEELSTLTAMLAEYQGIQTNADKTKEITQIEATNAAYAAQIATLDKLQKETTSLLDSTNVEGTPEQLQKVTDLINAWKAYQTQLAAQGVISAVANQAIQNLSTRLDDYKEHIQGVIDRLTMFDEADKKAIDQIAANAAEWAQTQPAFGDTAQEQRYQAALSSINQQFVQGKITIQEYDDQVQQLRFQFGEGGAATGVKQFFQEFQTGGQLAKGTFDLLKSSLDGFETDLADTLTTGAANWQDFFNSIEESILKLSLNTVFQSLLGLANDSSFLGNNFGSLFGSNSLFGPGHAAGGPVDPGVLYPIGENGPEWFKPSVPGSILPAGSLKNAGSSSKGSTQVINQTVNINGVQNVDSFKKSMPQVQAEMYRSAAMAHRRTNR